MKKLIAIGILLTGFTTLANAQTTRKLDDSLKLKRFKGMDSLTWHLPKTADALKQPIPQFYNQPTTELNFGESQLKPGSTVLLVYSIMPVVRSRSHYTMPVAHPAATNDKMNKPVQVNPSPGVVRP